MENRTYLCIDLKSFYASVECAARGLDPLTTNLVVADASRTEKTICLAVSPSLKACGLPGRPRLFEVVQKVKQVNDDRRRNAPGQTFSASSFNAPELAQNPSLELSYITAVPRMAHYIACSTKIYGIYLQFVSPDDIHVYSIDEVFIDLTRYLSAANVSARELAMKMIQKVFQETHITATAGIGTNMYLAKVAMDIVAKHIPADKNGVRIAELNEMEYRHQLWNHRPITDFWRIGKGYARKLEQHGMLTMGDVARCSAGSPSNPRNENLLYSLFGVNAELLIDHAWGWEPCTITEIKAYKPKASSLGSGQVLHCPYTADKAEVIVKEMVDILSLDLVDKRLVTDQIILTVGYDASNLIDSEQQNEYCGEVTMDYYGRKLPKCAHGTAKIGRQTASTKLLTKAVVQLYNDIIDRTLLIRRINLTANNIVSETYAHDPSKGEQLDLFTDYTELERRRASENAELEREKKVQQAALTIKKKFGKNAILKGLNLEDGATTIDRNTQIGGHKA